MKIQRGRNNFTQRCISGILYGCEAPCNEENEVNTDRVFICMSVDGWNKRQLQNENDDHINDRAAP